MVLNGVLILQYLCGLRCQTGRNVEIALTHVGQVLEVGEHKHTFHSENPSQDANGVLGRVLNLRHLEDRVRDGAQKHARRHVIRLQGGGRFAPASREGLSCRSIESVRAPTGS